jgi:hypothetical protein
MPAGPAGPAGASSTTLDDIDRPAWPRAPLDASRLVQRVHELRRKPLDRLTVEDLRLLIGQQVALGATVPLALGMLRHRALLEGDYYPGDLLMAVLGIPDEYWTAHPDQVAVLREAIDRLDPDDPEYPYLAGGDLVRAAARWRR